jgi:acetyl-CoA/propionyl-CoA carboxylase, biotin carboxylase, biotin carboxyl carrier protein
VTTTLPASSDGLAPAALRERTLHAELEGRRYELKLLVPEPPHAELARRRKERDALGGAHGGADEAVVSPMQGTVLSVDVAEGDEVEPGQVVCVVEAMKMENVIAAHRAGRVAELSVAAGEAVKTGQVICIVQAE